jgi:hypothetical protein
MLRLFIFYGEEYLVTMYDFFLTVVINSTIYAHSIAAFSDTTCNKWNDSVCTERRKNTRGRYISLRYLTLTSLSLQMLLLCRLDYARSAPMQYK